MKNMFLSEQLQKKVITYLMYTQSTNRQQKELDYFLGLLAPSLKSMVVRHLLKSSLKKRSNFSLHDRPELLDLVVNHAQILLFLPEDPIVRQGE